MQKDLQQWVDHLLAKMGMSPTQMNGLDHWVVLLLILAFAAAVHMLCRYVLMRTVRRIVVHTKATWDDLVFNETVMRRLCHLVAPLLVYLLLPVAFSRESLVLRIVLRLLQVWLIYLVVRFINAMISVAFDFLAARPGWRSKPIKGLRQTGQGIVMLIGGILAVSVLIQRSPAILLTGLGASAAIVLLIFRDSILGFVSGIQLAANNMLQVGDWIAMPKYGADGTVEEVSLTTVKIRNWDNTIVTLPPYLLVSDSFQNWQGMVQSGGRRVKRSVNIDMTSVRFLTPTMIDHYRSVGLLRDYITHKQRDVDDFNAQRKLEPGHELLDGRHQTNLGVFRAYLVSYLRAQTRVNQQMTLMVRQMQPTETGLPMELYFFTNTVVWVEYESIQSDVFDHVLAVIPLFGLRVFQNPAGSDLLGLRSAASEEEHDEQLREDHPKEHTDGVDRGV